MIVLSRAYLPDESAVLGKWVMPGGWSCYTLENPWVNNERRVSCIPEGVYTLGMRDSPVVARTTAGEYTRGWEITNVPGRTFIMIHPGNWTHNTDGCVLVGRAISWDSRGFMVTQSRDTFRYFMKEMACQQAHTLKIKTGGPVWN
jgi:hypothetical protein